MLNLVKNQRFLGVTQEFQSGFFSAVFRVLRIQGSNGFQGFCVLPKSRNGLSVITSTVPLTNFFVPVPSFCNARVELDGLLLFCEPENILGIDQPWAVAVEVGNKIAMPSNIAHTLASFTKTSFRIQPKTCSV